jgi:photosystem II stability/assembly factor-like uncharacterized protein
VYSALAPEGGCGDLLHSTDGGSTWTPQTVPLVSRLNSVAFTDANLGWAAGYAGVIAHTTDGGSLWEPQLSGTTNDLYGVSFIDAFHGWAVGGGWRYDSNEVVDSTWSVILHTSCGGLQTTPVRG